MTLDRQQIQRDAEDQLRKAGYLNLEFAPFGDAIKLDSRLARHCLALLTELEQAEEGRRQALVAHAYEKQQKHAAEARLANVPALVDALRSFVEPDPDTDGYGEIDAGVAALAAWDNQ